MSESLLIIFGCMITLIILSILIDFIYHHIKFDFCNDTDLKVTYIDMYSPNNQYQDILNIDDIDNIEIEIRDGMVLYDACFTVSNNTNILTIIEIPIEKLITDVNKYNQYKEITALCADKKERKINIKQHSDIIY